MFNMYRIKSDNELFHLITIPPNFPNIVCLCGSTRFKDDFIKASMDETIAGNIVLSVGAFGHLDNIPNFEVNKPKFDLLHFRKIELSDEILVINRDGYVGESTSNEIAHAVKLDKHIRWMFPDQIPKRYL
jgi:hypothetical protein